jgi:hypothetical protein
MEDERKHVLLAGVYLGDIALAQAGFARELPAYVKGLDYAGLVPDDEDGRRIRAKVDDLLLEDTGGALPESITRLVLTQAVDKGKFLSAIRCLELLGERDETVDKYLADIPRLLAEGKPAEAAEALIIASNLDNDDGIPLFQATGADLHAGCTEALDACITRLGGDDAVLKALGYLAATEKAAEAIARLRPEERKTLLPFVALERDPDAGGFFAELRAVQHDVESMEKGAIAGLTSTVTDITAVLTRFAEALGEVQPQPDGRGDLDKLKRTADSLMRDFAGAAGLVADWQFRRLADRFERLTKSRDELSDLKDRLAAAGGPGAGAVDSALELIDRLATTGRDGVVAVLEAAGRTLAGMRDRMEERDASPTEVVKDISGAIEAVVRELRDDPARDPGRFKDDFMKIKDRLKGGDALLAALVDRMIDLVDTIGEKGIAAGYVKAVENSLAYTQTRLLGRQVHTEEHWQFLREIAFKYPMSPLMCCLKRFNDRWLVVPRWDSEIAGLLRSHFEREGAAR